MQLLADENIQAATVRFLEGLGHDVQRLEDAGLRSAADEKVFTHAQRERRVLLTFNVDFVDLRALKSRNHSGIIRLRVSNQRGAFLHPILESALRSIADLELTDTLVTVADRRTRMRKTSSP